MKAADPEKPPSGNIEMSHKGEQLRQRYQLASLILNCDELPHQEPTDYVITFCMIRGTKDKNVKIGWR